MGKSTFLLSFSCSFFKYFFLVPGQQLSHPPSHPGPWLRRLLVHVDPTPTDGAGHAARGWLDADASGRMGLFSFGAG